jgi:ankyrin repeat protein
VSACNGHIEVVSKLLEEGIDVNATLEVSVNADVVVPLYLHISNRRSPLPAISCTRYRIPYTLSTSIIPTVHYIFFDLIL